MKYNIAHLLDTGVIFKDDQDADYTMYVIGDNYALQTEDGRPVDRLQLSRDRETGATTTLLHLAPPSHETEPDIFDGTSFDVRVFKLIVNIK